tara:strand:+ start:6357 stop:7061 length:705 start_codon:yes stop_codon:yes gene_type:complete
MNNKLAKKGRFGDTEIIKTSKGSLWHVNKEEKKLIEDYGYLGEQIVDTLGSGTINPETGLEEKFPPLMAALAVASFAAGSAQSYGQTRSMREQGRSQVNYLDKSLASLKEAERSLGESLGSSLALPSLEAQRVSETISEKGVSSLENIRERQEAISGSTGFANIGMDSDQIAEARKIYEDKLEDVDISLSKSLSDVLSNFEQQKFEMQSQRQQLEQQRKLAQQQANTKYFGIFG